ncbi:MAG: hypothetical protein EOO03_17665 [Chitinophagaceae bacterium]|nr:MAG: hypothetical protein EOO03_17665 [Chitinophagaceae bacterium]
MELRETILQEHSVAQRDLIVQWVGREQQRFDELFEYMLSSDVTLAQRASWAVSNCAEAQPQLVRKHLKQLIKVLQQTAVHDAVLRNSARVLSQLTAPANLHGMLMDACFKLVEKPSTSIAVKAFSLEILGKLAATYPDIAPEIKLLIASMENNASPGIKSKCRQVSKMLSLL